MLDRDLRNFDKYISILEKYAKAAKIKVKYQEGDFEGGEYNHQSRTIRIDPTESHKAQISAFLHELGHAFDDVICSPELVETLFGAYTRYYSNKPLKPYQKSLIIDCETRAWEYGLGLAKMLRIPLGKWYNEYKIKSLRMYRVQ